MTSLRDSFEVTDNGDLTWLLGTTIIQDLTNGVVSLHQTTYIEDLMQTYLPSEIKEGKKARSVPCTEQITTLSSDVPPDKVDQRYRTCVGKLLWLVMVTRPDMAYAVSILARFNNCGGAAHMEHIFNCIR